MVSLLVILAVIICVGSGNAFGIRCCIVSVVDRKIARSRDMRLSLNLPRVVKNLSAIAPLVISFTTTINPLYTSAKEDLPSLEKIFNAVRKELSPEGESLNRLRSDIKKEEWEDILIFTREYDAGFRGGVLKSAWKQLGDRKQRGIEVSNSFTFDLIALNKAARSQDKIEAMKRLDQVRRDLVDFEALDPSKQTTTGK